MFTENDDDTVLPGTALCACGCDETFRPERPNQIYIKGHRKGRKPPEKKNKQEPETVGSAKSSEEFFNEDWREQLEKHSGGKSRRLPTLTGEQDGFRRRKYLLALKSDAPVHHTQVGAGTFSEWTDTRVERDDVLVLGAPRRGAFQFLTDEQFEDILDRAPRYVARWRNKEKRQGNRVVIGPRYRPRPSDEPLARYLILIPAEAVAADALENIDELPSMEAMYYDEERESLPEAINAQAAL